MAVQMGGKRHALLGDLPQAGQRKHLKSAGIRQNRAVPGHELVQSSHGLNHLVAGTQVQVIGVAKLNLSADVLEIKGAEGTLNGALGSHIHENRGLYRAMGTGEFAPPRQALRFDYLKHSPSVYSMNIASPKLKKR